MASVGQQPYVLASPTYSRRSDDEDDYASFCFCGEEVEPDSDGEVGIYCSTKCARQDALFALSSGVSAPPTGPSSHTYSPTTSALLPNLTAPFASSTLPNSESQTTLRQADVPSFDHFLATTSHSLGPPPPSSSSQFLDPSPLPKRTPSEEEAFQNGSASATGMYDDGTEAGGTCEPDWQASHYRRMHRERQQMLEERRKRREARKQAASHAASLNSLRSSQQQRAGSHRHQPSTSSMSSSTDYSLSRSNTASSTTSSASRFVSTHPSRARTPDLLSSRNGHHGRNESLGSSISSLSSSSFSHSHNLSQPNSFWTLPAPKVAAEGGWGSGAELAIREEGEELYDGMDEDEGEDDAVDRMGPILNRFGGGGAGGMGRMLKRPKQPQPPLAQQKGGMRMSDVLDSILDMEKGFFSPPTSPSQPDLAPPPPPPSFVSSSTQPPSSWTATPPKKSFAGSSATTNLTPKATTTTSSSTSQDPFNPQTPQLHPKHQNKRSAPSPPSPPRSRVASGSSNKTTSFRLNHRQSASWSSAKHDHHHRLHGPTRKASMDAGGVLASAVTIVGEGIKRSGSPLPPPPSRESRARTLVYSPASAPEGLGEMMEVGGEEDAVERGRMASFGGEERTWSFPRPNGSQTSRTSSPSSDEPRPFVFGQHHHVMTTEHNHTRDVSSGSQASSYSLPIFPPPFHQHSAPNSSSIFSNRYPLNLDDPPQPLAPPLFPSTPGTQGTPEFERMIREGERERFCFEAAGGIDQAGGEGEEEEEMGMDDDDDGGLTTSLGVSCVGSVGGGDGGDEGGMMATMQQAAAPLPPSSSSSSSWFRRRF